MLGLLLLYWIGKYYYTLAENYNKNKWAYAFLGIGIYYGAMIVFGFFIGVVSEIVSPGYVETVNETFFSILMIPLGALSCYVLYKFLERTWEFNKPSDDDILADVKELEI